MILPIVLGDIDLQLSSTEKGRRTGQGTGFNSKGMMCWPIIYITLDRSRRATRKVQSSRVQSSRSRGSAGQVA